MRARGIREGIFAVEEKRVEFYIVYSSKYEYKNYVP